MACMCVLCIAFYTEFSNDALFIHIAVGLSVLRRLKLKVVKFKFSQVVEYLLAVSFVCIHKGLLT